MDLEDAERFNTLIVEPAVSRITATIDPLVKRIESLESRVGGLERVARPFVYIYSLIAGLLVYAGKMAWSKFRTKTGV